MRRGRITMLKKISDNPTDYKSDTPKQDFKCFEKAMKQIVKAAPIKVTQKDRGKTSSK